MGEGYNGYRNYETWNVILWMSNDEGLYSLARDCDSYDEYRSVLREIGTTETPDKVSYNDSGLDTDEINEAMAEL